jgi:hypothetical protein
VNIYFKMARTAVALSGVHRLEGRSHLQIKSYGLVV